MRKKKAIYTVITALMLQVTLIIVNLILPHFIILKYGSNVNGLINSITQFLSYIALLETGIGAVIKSVLYKSLAKKDKKEISSIVVTTQHFFRKVSYILIIYIIALIIIFPKFVSSEFDRMYTISLLIIIAINSFMQYYFGLTSQILIQADQKGYIINICKIITYIVSTVVMVVMIFNNYSIQTIKAVGTIILIISPLYYYYYMKKKYYIDKKEKVNNDLLKQRWDGFAHQISSFIHNNTDIAVLTVFSNMGEVSVYSVYTLVTSGIKSVLGILTSSISATFGNIYGSGEKDKIKKQFEIFDYFNLLIVFFVFTITGLLITPFIKLYVSGATDANYNRMIFGTIIVVAEAIYCLRCSYSNMIFIIGDFKQTKFHGYIESGLNLIISLLLVKKFNLIGIAIGTLIGMLYRLIVSIKYVHKYLIDINILNLFKKYIVNIIVVFVFVTIVKMMKIPDIITYFEWIKYAVIYSIIFLTLLLVTNILFFKKDMKDIYYTYFEYLISKIKRMKKSDEKDRK